MEPGRKQEEEEAIPTSPVIESRPSFLSHSQFRRETLHGSAQGDIQLYKAGIYAPPVQITNQHRDKILNRFTQYNYFNTVMFKAQGITELSLIIKGLQIKSGFPDSHLGS